MKTAYTRTFAIENTEFGLLSDPEMLFRLAPQWNVKSYLQSGDGDSELSVEYDRSEADVSFIGKIEAFEYGRQLKLKLTNPEIQLEFMAEVVPSLNHISFTISTFPEPEDADMREYDLWARSIVNYHNISHSRSVLMRVWKYFLDRFWLKMSQFGKRMVFFIVIGEGFSFVFLIALLLWWKFFSSR